MLTYLLSSIVSEFSHSKCQKSLYITTPLRLNPPTEGFPWDDLRKIFCGCQWMAKVSYGEKRPECAKTNSTLKRYSFGNRRFLKGVRNFERQFQVDGDAARNRSMDRWIGEWYVATTLPLEVFTKTLCSRLFREKLNFTGTNSDIAFLCHPLGDLGVTYTVHLWFVGKRMVCHGRLPIGDNWTFSLAITIEALWADIGRNCAVEKGVSHFERKFHGERGVPHQQFVATEY